MRITKIEAIPVAIPFEHDGPPTGFGGTTWSKLNFLLVKVETEDGLVGWGEAFGTRCIPATKAALDSIVAPLVVGRDARDMPGLTREVLHSGAHLRPQRPVRLRLLRHRDRAVGPARKAQRPTLACAARRIASHRT